MPTSTNAYIRARVSEEIKNQAPEVPSCVWRNGTYHV